MIGENGLIVRRVHVALVHDIVIENVIIHCLRMGKFKKTNRQLFVFMCLIS